MTQHQDSDYNPDDFIKSYRPAEATSSFKSFYDARARLINNPIAGGKAPKGTPGKISISRKVGDTYETTEVDSILCCVLYDSRVRKFREIVDGKLTITCSSQDAEVPDARIISPKCAKTTREQVRESLLKYKVAEAKIEGHLAQIFEADTCTKCSARLGNKLFPVCGRTSKDLKNKCEEVGITYLYDLNTKKVIQFEIRGQSDRSYGDKIAPYHKFIQSIPRGQALHSLMCVFTPRLADNGFFIVDVVDPTPVTDAALLGSLRATAESVKRGHEDLGIYVPKARERVE